MPMLESPHLIISILYLTDRAANRTYHCVCARDGTSRQPGSQAIRINYTNCISMSRVLMDHRPRRRCSMLASRYPMLISIIVKITAQCTSNFVDGKEWLPLPLPVPQGTPGPGRGRAHARRRSVSAVVYGPRQPQKQETQVVEGGKKTKREKQNWAPLDCPLRWPALFIVSVNSEACLNSEMNLWINTIMVIWHPLWMPLRVFVCPPAALEAGQTFLDLPLAVALDVASGLGSSSAPVDSTQFQFQFQPRLRLRSILPDNLLPTV